MDNQGKTNKQLRDSYLFIVIGIIGIALTLVLSLITL